MKNIELKRFLNKNVLPDLELSQELELKQNFLYKNDIEGKLLKGFCFEASQYNDNGFYLWAFVQPLYVPLDSIVLTFGHRIRLSQTKEWWGIDPKSKKMATVVKKLQAAIMQETKTFLDKVNSPDAFYHYYSNNKQTNVRTYEAVIYSSFYARNQEAFKEAESFLNILKETQDLTIPWIKQIEVNVDELIQLGSYDKIMLKLNGWQSETVKCLNL